MLSWTTWHRNTSFLLYPILCLSYIHYTYHNKPTRVLWFINTTLKWLFQVIARHMFSTKTIPEPKISVPTLAQTLMKFESEDKKYPSRTCIWKCFCKISAILSGALWTNPVVEHNQNHIENHSYKNTHVQRASITIGNHNIKFCIIHTLCDELFQQKNM